MKRFLSTFLALTAVTTSVLGADLELVKPKGTPLTLSSLRESESTAEYRGRITVDGRLVAQWVPEIDDESREPKVQAFRLYVLSTSSERLPHFQGYPVEKIEITNGLAALRMATSPSKYRDFMEKRLLLLEVMGEFELQDFSVGVECDSQWARSLVTHVVRPTLLVSRRGEISFGC